MFYENPQTGSGGGHELGYALLVNGVVTFTSTGLVSGSDYVYGIYFGDDIYASSTSNYFMLTVTAQPTTLTLTSTANPSPSLTPITFTAHLSAGTQPVAGSTISYLYNPTGTAPVIGLLTTDATGSASFTAGAGFTPGHDTITAAFAGMNGLLASSASLVEVVNANPTTTTLTATPNPGIQTNPVTLSAAVAASVGAVGPTGTVTFLDGATALATVPVTSAGGVTSAATFTTPSLSPGSHTLSAVYTPATISFLASQSTAVTEPISPQDFTFTANPPSITIETQHHSPMQLTLTSIGGFTAPITFSCGSNLPPVLTCEWPRSATTLEPNATIPVSLTLKPTPSSASCPPPLHRRVRPRSLASRWRLCFQSLCSVARAAANSGRC